MRAMNQRRILASLAALLALGLLLHGPIAQWASYHAFADQRGWLGIPHAAAGAALWLLAARRISCGSPR